MGRPQHVSTAPKQILHGTVRRQEALRVANGRESSHLVLALSRQLMRDFRSVVLVLLCTVHDRRHHGTVRRGGTDAPICQDSRSRSQVCGLARSVVCHHALKDLAGEKAFETADDLPFGPPFSGASFDVVEGW